MQVGEYRVGSASALVEILEVADTDQKRATGLMFRDSMAADHGMLFVHEQPRDAGADLLYAAAMLHDIGITVGYDGSECADAAVGASAHRVIAVTPWFGYSRQEILPIIADSNGAAKVPRTRSGVRSARMLLSFGACLTMRSMRSSARR